MPTVNRIFFLTIIFLASFLIILLKNELFHVPGLI